MGNIREINDYINMTILITRSKSLDDGTFNTNIMFLDISHRHVFINTPSCFISLDKG
jgi:hypothetical protein